MMSHTLRKMNQSLLPYAYCPLTSWELTTAGLSQVPGRWGVVISGMQELPLQWPLLRCTFHLWGHLV